MSTIDEILEQLSYESVCVGFTTNNHEDLDYSDEYVNKAKQQIRQAIDRAEPKARSSQYDMWNRGIEEFKANLIRELFGELDSTKEERKEL